MRLDLRLGRSVQSADPSSEPTTERLSSETGTSTFHHRFVNDFGGTRAKAGNVLLRTTADVMPPAVQKTVHNMQEEFSENSDESLLMAYRDGDRDAYAELVRRYERELYSYLRRYIGDAAGAEDVFQATFLKVHLNAHTFDFEAKRKVRPWLYTIATNQAIDYQRRNKRHRLVSLDRRNSEDENGEDVGQLLGLLESAEPSPDASLEAAERKASLERAMQYLPDHQREAIFLIYYKGLKYQEVADLTGQRIGTIKSRLHTAIQNLGKILREQPDERRIAG